VEILARHLERNVTADFGDYRLSHQIEFRLSYRNLPEWMQRPQLLKVLLMKSLFLKILTYFVSMVLALWTAGAIFYDVGSGGASGVVLAAAWIALVLAAFFFLKPPWKPLVLLLIVFAFFSIWWFSQEPSQHRNWDPHCTSLSHITLEGDAITIKNVRNSEYHAIGDSTPRYETRDYRLSQLHGVDVLILNWGSPWMSHPMFVFDFGPDGRICISIEVRYRVGQEFSLLRSLYRQQELIYIVSDERDAILRRTKYLEGHNLHLYRLLADALVVRQFFLEYANTINALAQTPRWYHGLTTNCSTSIYAQGRGRMRWDWRMLFNGTLDRLMYDRKLLEQGLPFEQLKELSLINEIANQAPSGGFGDYLRQKLPGYRLDRDEAGKTAH